MSNEEIRVQVEPVGDPQTWRQMLDEVKARANEAKGNIVDHLLKAAENLREQAQDSGDAEAVEQAERLARSLEESGLYLDSHTVEELGKEVREVIAARPGPALVIVFFIGLIVGFIIARR